MLGNKEYDVFADMFERVTVTQANLEDINIANQEVDRVLEQCWILKKPVYIRLPTDMAEQQLEAGLLRSLLHLDPPLNDLDVESSVINSILDLIHTAKYPIFLVHANASRYGVGNVMSML